MERRDWIFAGGAAVVVLLLALGLFFVTGETSRVATPSPSPVGVGAPQLEEGGRSVPAERSTLGGDNEPANFPPQTTPSPVLSTPPHPQLSSPVRNLSSDPWQSLDALRAYTDSIKSLGSSPAPSP